MSSRVGSLVGIAILDPKRDRHWKVQVRVCSLVQSNHGAWGVKQNRVRIKDKTVNTSSKPNRHEPFISTFTPSLSDLAFYQNSVKAGLDKHLRGQF